MTPETQTSIVDWARATFGVPDSALSLAVRANQEVAELLVAAMRVYAAAGDDQQWEEETALFAAELADVYIVYCQVADKLGFVLSAEAGDHIEAEAVRVSTRINLRSANILSNLALGSPTALQFAQADITVLAQLLSHLAESHGDNLRDLVTRKMAVNRHREWVVLGRGLGQHR
jgi:hypothetical protein